MDESSEPLNVKRTYRGGEVEMISEGSAIACLSGHLSGDEWSIEKFRRTGRASSPNAAYERMQPVEG